ncbi:MAG: 50S ribosomal protein L23 [Desulfovibrio sp.]|nr:MAG: 50S ribosomal protein L23 [Desulfovibrio sp.]
MDHTQVLIKPLVSEKATFAKEIGNQVVFYVHPQANKIEVRKAVQDTFKVTVEAVNIVRKRPYVKSRFGRKAGRVAGYKKAYVTLAPGDKIEFFEGV